MTESSSAKTSMAKDWQAQQERGTPFLLNLLTWVALHLGRRMVFVWLCAIVFYYFLSFITK